MLETTIFLYLIGCSGTEKNNDDTSVHTNQADTGEDTAQTNIESTEMFFPENNDSEWETVEPIDVFPAWDEDAEAALLHFLEERRTKSFMILHNGYIVSEHYFNGHDKDSEWNWESAGKALTSVMVGIAQQEGFFDIHEPVSTYLGTGWTSASENQELQITIRHLLTMTSGLDDRNGADVSPDNLQYLADAGTRWAYHNVFVTLHAVLANAVGQSWQTYFQTKLRDPIGMNGSWNDMESRHLYTSNTRSMARFGLLALNKGKWNDTQIVNEAYFLESTQSSQEHNPAYGYLWWINGQDRFLMPVLQEEYSGSIIFAGPDDMVMALGKHDQKVYVVPSSNMVVIRMGENASDPNLAISPFDIELWERLSVLTQ